MLANRISFSFDASLAIPTCVLRFEVSRRARIPSPPPSLRSWLCGSTKEPDGFVVNRRKPLRLGAASMPIPLMTWPPRSSQLDLGFDAQPRNRTRLCLGFLATIRPALDPVGHRVPRTKPNCLSTPERPLMHRPFALVLHLYQHKSNRNLHLQYSSRVSPYHVVNHSSHQGATIHRSSGAPVLTHATKVFYISVNSHYCSDDLYLHLQSNCHRPGLLSRRSYARSRGGRGGPARDPPCWRPRPLLPTSLPPGSLPCFFFKVG
jgi:hypothetical protein